MLAVFKREAARGYALLFPAAFKRRTELKYWRSRYVEESNSLNNSHYEPLYTDVYDLDKSDFVGKSILDIGCGPRGSLEWADMTSQRVGLDPLVPRYLKLGADRHKMEYAASGSENIPFPNAHFDIVACLNALDHVDNFDATIAEIKRVTKPGGWFLLSVEIDHPPTPTEPITITEAGLGKLGPEFGVVSSFRVGTPTDHNLHLAVTTRSPPYTPGEPGIYVARYLRR